MSQTTIERVIEQLKGLPERQQEQVLVYARSLRTKVTAGVPGASLLKFAGSIPHEDLQLMEQAMDCSSRHSARVATRDAGRAL